MDCSPAALRVTEGREETRLQSPNMYCVTPGGALPSPVIMPPPPKDFRGGFSDLAFFSFFSFFPFFFFARKLATFFAASGVQLAQPTSGFFHFRRAAFSSQLKSKVGNVLVKSPGLRHVLNIDGTHIASKSHTHPSHSQTSHLLTSSLCLGGPVPHATKCM